MIVREREYKECQECGTRQLVKEEAIGCDHCGKVLDLAKRHVEYVGDLTIFTESKSTHYRFCTVDCAFEYVRTMKIPKDFNFISLPLLSGKSKLRTLQRTLKEWK